MPKIKLFMQIFRFPGRCVVHFKGEVEPDSQGSEGRLHSEDGGHDSNPQTKVKELKY